MHYLLQMITLPEIKSIPEYAFDALVAEIREFQGSLSADKEVGIMANGAGTMLHVESLYLSSQIIVFKGVDRDGNEARLLQHYTQANVQMFAADKIAETARRIGF